MALPSALEKLVADYASCEQDLVRTPEPDGVTNSEGSVTDYSAMMNSNITANYALSLDLIHRIRSPKAHAAALDLCCGPGHVTICLAKYLDYKHIVGLDLSERMIAAAQTNAHAQSCESKVSFQQQSVLNLQNQAAASFDLVSFTNSAHHLASVSAVSQVLKEAERVARPSGLVFVSDLARLKNASVTNQFVQLVGAEYGDCMRRDFFNSMHAAWLPEELVQAIPPSSRRTWVSVVLEGLPFFQVLVGLPIGRKKLYLRSSKNWQNAGIFPHEAAAQDWRFMAEGMSKAQVRWIEPYSELSISMQER